MQTQQPPQTGTESGFQPIPTRINELPPLIIEKEDNPITHEVTNRLDDLSDRVAQIHRAAAEAYMSQGMYDEALPHAEAAATFAPTVLEYHNQLGFIRYIKGDDAGAVESFQRVLAAQPTQPDALFNLGMVQFGREDYTTAEDCFRRVLESRPDDAETWNNRGVCLHQIGRTADAAVCFERAMQIDPQNADAQANIAALTGS